MERKTNENEVCLGALFGTIASESDRNPNQGVILRIIWKYSNKNYYKKTWWTPQQNKVTINLGEWRLTYIARILFEHLGNLVRGARPGELGVLAQSRNSDTRVGRRCSGTSPYLFQAITYLLVIKSAISLKRALCPYNVLTCCQVKSACASLRAQCLLLRPCMCLVQ